jgi:hypothetical protein
MKKAKTERRRRPLIRVGSWQFGSSRKQRVAIWALVIFAVLFAAHNVIERLWRPVAQPIYGVSFSIKYSKELGNDWQANYLALLDDLQFRHLRLMSYWDLLEPERGKYDFADLDWQMDEAAKRGARVSLSIGYRQPRWPECHQPRWANDLPYDTEPWRIALDTYITNVVNRYKSHPALASYQLENEAVNNWFGTCPGAARHERLVKEFDLIKRIDPDHPVWMSLSDQHGFPLNDPVPDKYGFSVYRTVWNDRSPINFYMTYPTPIWYHRGRAALIREIKDRDIFVHELQIEPWGPQPTQMLSVHEQNKSMDLRQIRKNFDFGRKISARELYTWGGEWWYWRKTHFDDPTVWEAVRAELSFGQQP